MRILGPSTHGALDIVTVIVFAVAPTLIGFEGFAATLAYVLAAVHLVMSVVTEGLPISVSNLVPLPLHGMVEAVVGVTIGLIGWLAFDGAAQTFYLLMGIVILLVFSVSRYDAAAD